VKVNHLKAVLVDNIHRLISDDLLITIGKVGAGCLVFGVWCLVFGVWCLVFGVWCLVFGVWCLVLVDVGGGGGGG
jgi:hypothetical protein